MLSMLQKKSLSSENIPTCASAFGAQAGKVIQKSDVAGKSKYERSLWLPSLNPQDSLKFQAPILWLIQDSPLGGQISPREISKRCAGDKTGDLERQRGT